MSKFKVGDKVYLRGDSRWNDGSVCNPLDTLGEVRDTDVGLYTILVDWDNGEFNSYDDNDLFLAQNHPKVVIFNAPKNTGKDFMIEACSDMLEHRAFKTKLYELTAEYYDIEMETLLTFATDRILKEEPMSLFLGKSPREALIHVSEDITKPKMGKDYFGKALVASLEDGGVYGVSDSGFQEEYDTVVEGVGGENVLLIRMFSQDSTFEGDSRSYVEYPRGAGVVNFFNDKTEKSVEGIREIIKEWLYE